MREADEEPREGEKREFDWFDRPKVRAGLWKALWISCGLTLVAEAILRMARGPESGLHLWFGAYAVLGFVSCALMIVAAKALGFVLKRPPDYWGASDGEEKSENLDESA